MISVNTKYMKSALIFIFSIFGSAHAISQDYYFGFMELFRTKEPTEVRAFLQEWEAHEPTNAELFTCYFNYYFSISKHETVQIADEAFDDEQLTFVDSSGIRYYIGSGYYFDELYIDSALTMINKGIELYPNRLDMRFGKIYLLGEIQNWALFTENIIETVEYSNKNDCNWTWTNNAPVTESKDFMLISIQDYQIQLYDTQVDSLIENMIDIAQTILTYYPTHIESLTNLGIAYTLQKKYELALDYLNEAEKLAPDDDVVINNIAFCYAEMDDVKNAKKYYLKLTKSDDSDTAEYARDQLKKLENRE